MKPAKRKQTSRPKERRINQLERDTAAYFDNMTEEERKEDEELGRALAQAAKGIDFDAEE
jgi:hypothetical protein